MRILKQIIFILFVLCIGVPVRAMESGNGDKSLSGQLWHVIEEHPVIVGTSAALLGLTGLYAYREPLLKQQLLAASASGAGWRVNLLLKLGAPVHVKDEDSLTPLHKAVCAGSAEVVKMLLAAGADIEARSAFHHTPLHDASYCGNTKMVEMLLLAGADIAASGYSRLGNHMPLDSAIARDHVEVMKLLLKKGATFDIQNARKWGSLLCKSEAVRRVIFNSLANADAIYNLLVIHDVNQSFYLRKIIVSSEFIDDQDRKVSFDRIMSALCIFKRNNLPKDIQLKLLSYMPEDVLTATHARLLLNYGTNITDLLAHCPLEWLIQIYQNTDQMHRQEFLGRMIPVIVQYRLGRIRAIFTDEQIQRLDPNRIDPDIITMLYPNNVQQYGADIERNVLAIFLGEEQVGLALDPNDSGMLEVNNVEHHRAAIGQNVLAAAVLGEQVGLILDPNRIDPDIIVVDLKHVE